MTDRTEKTRDVDCLLKLEKIATEAGELELARRGDVEVARRAIGRFCHLADRQLGKDPHLPEGRRIPDDLLEYVVECMRKMLRGESPLVAWNISSGSKGRPAATLAGLHEKFMVVLDVFKQMEVGNNLDESCRIAKKNTSSPLLQ